MKLNRVSTILTALTAVTMFDVLSVAKPTAAIQLTGLTDNNALVFFDSSNPSSTSSVAVTGVQGNLIGIDFRPANGVLYGVTNTNGIYTINPTTGAANLVSTISPVAFNLGQQTGLDFNPAPNLLRVVDGNGNNLRINVETGQVQDGNAQQAGLQPDANLAYAAGDPNFGTTPRVTAEAYTNSFVPSPAATRPNTLYGIDSNLDILVRQGGQNFVANPVTNPPSPNTGQLFTVGSLGVDFGSAGGFDIFSTGIGANNQQAFAASGSSLYGIDLSSGAATTLGTIGDGSANVIGLSSATVPEPTTVGSLIGFGALALVGRFRRRVKSHS